MLDPLICIRNGNLNKDDNLKIWDFFILFIFLFLFYDIFSADDTVLILIVS